MTDATQNSVFQDWDVKNRAYNERAAQLDNVNKAAVFEALARAGVTTVTVDFDGFADSGQIESLVARNADNPIDLPTEKIEIAEAEWDRNEIKSSLVSLSEAIEIMVYRFLERSHSGWGNGEGAYGDFTFDVASRAITLDYNERFIESVNSQHRF